MQIHKLLYSENLRNIHVMNYGGRQSFDKQGKTEITESYLSCY